MGGTLRVRTWRPGVGNCLTLGVGNYLIPPLGNCLTLQGLSLGNYLIADTNQDLGMPAATQDNDLSRG